MTNAFTLTPAATASINAAAYALGGKVAAWTLFIDAAIAASMGGNGFISTETVDAVAQATGDRLAGLGLPTNTLKAARKTLTCYASALRRSAELQTPLRGKDGGYLSYNALCRANVAADPAAAAAAAAASAADKAAVEAAEAAERENVLRAIESARAAEAAAAEAAAHLQALIVERDALRAALEEMTVERDALRVALAEALAGASVPAPAPAPAPARKGRRAAATV